MSIYSLGAHGKLHIANNGKFTLFTGCDSLSDRFYTTERPNFEINLSGGGLLTRGTLKLAGIYERTDGADIIYTHGDAGLEVTVSLTTTGTGVLVQQNRVKNVGDKPQLLTRFSSTFFENIACESDGAWYDNKDIRIHICHNKWQGEGQWETFTAEELGLYPVSTHPWERASYRVQSNGSWSTGNFYPLVMVEDKKHNKIWFCETEGSHSWLIKLTGFGGYSAPCLAMEASGCDENNGGWHYELLPGETYTAERAFIGCVPGGFEEAVASLTAFKRADSLCRHPNDIPPVIFNDYMDCVWSNQSPDAILPLIDAAADAGCEYFVIDGGWSCNRTGNGLGDWIPRNDLYKKTDLRAIADRIKARGMIPGIWFELDAVDPTADGFHLDEDAVLRRYGRPVGHGSRTFYNFGCEAVRKYLIERIAEYYDMGYRFIKNDYNQSSGIGSTNNGGGDSPAEGQIRAADDFTSFIEELYERFPGLVIENCGSGALRDDNKMLRRFSLQSTSDQELYENNPSIVMGSMAQMPPEKAGIWSYPYPTVLGEHMNFTVTDEYAARMVDGRQTAFNLVNAMPGLLYLSGRIDLADDHNFALVKEGVDFYKSIRHLIGQSRPIYPTGMHRLNDRETASLGLLSEKALLLCVWNITDGAQDVSIDLSKYGVCRCSNIARIYPSTQTILPDGGSVTLPLAAMSAAALLIEL
ncbi:MAG: alpha-galactosidase [Clostridia bacterium]|nr:alpha-galactosidase [Clostridia bacterium]